MKRLYYLPIIFLGMVFNPAEASPREDFQQNSENIEQIETIANEQGIDLSTRDGKRALAEYLHESGQSDLLPPRPQRRQMGGGSEDSSSLSDNGQRRPRHRRRGGRN